MFSPSRWMTRRKVVATRYCPTCTKLLGSEHLNFQPHNKVDGVTKDTFNVILMRPAIQICGPCSIGGHRCGESFKYLEKKRKENKKPRPYKVPA